MASSPEVICCQICFEEITAGVDESSALVSPDETTVGTSDINVAIVANVPNWHGCDANNKFCGNCVTQYLKSCLSESKFSPEGRIPCPCAEKCGATFGEEDVKVYLTAFDLFWKYLLFSKRAQVESDPNTFFCPNPTCGDDRVGGTVVKGSENRLRWQLKCHECGLRFCKKCGNSHSVLASCESVLENGFHNWKYTTRQGCKPCPSCKYYIEKNEGCNHMTCCKCRHQFCWLCLSDYSSGCTGGNLCKVKATWHSHRWGASPITRFVSRTTAMVLALPAVGVGVGILAVGASCAAAAGSLAAPAVVLVSASRIIQQSYYYLRRHEMPVIVHMPWNRRVTWINSIGDGDSEAGQFLGYQGRHHPSGIFVARATLTTTAGEHQSFKSWLKEGPPRISNRVNVVLYFVPNGTSSATLLNMLPYYTQLPRTAYPGCIYNLENETAYQEVQGRLEERVVSVVNQYLENGHRIPREHVMHGLMTDDTDYGLPEPESDLSSPPVFDREIKRCSHCTIPKYFTNSILYEEHLITDHYGQSGQTTRASEALVTS